MQLQLLNREEEVKELRRRSLRVLEGWFMVVEGVNICVEEWDLRLRGVETLVRRRERVMEEEETY